MRMKATFPFSKHIFNILPSFTLNPIKRFFVYISCSFQLLVFITVSSEVRKKLNKIRNKV